jgi:hypothetical protein
MRAFANQLTASHRSAAFAALLSLCLLLAQAVGFMHAYAHADRAHEAATSPFSKHKLFDHAKSACAAFDAAALSAVVHTPVFSLPARTVHAEPVCSLQTEVLSCRYRAHFNPRAPPLAT